MKRLALFSALISQFLVANFSLAQTTQPGLDPIFGDKGIARTEPFTNGGFKSVYGIAIQPDGKILIAGNYVARYTTTGKPDSTFGGTGFIPVDSLLKPLGGVAGTVLLQPDGNIVIAGAAMINLANYGAFVLRLKANGSMDSSFGTFGSTHFWSGGGPGTLQTDGKILLASVENSQYAGLHRFLTNGQPDSSFGNNGIVRTDLLCNSSVNGIGVLPPDGRIAIGGIGCRQLNGTQNLVALRYMPDGRLDSAYGINGIAYPTIASYCRNVVVQSDGSLLAALSGVNGFDAVARVDASGAIDNSFGINGFFTIDSLGIYGLAPMADGRLLCGGLVKGDYAVARLLPNATSVDAAFGQSGIIATDVTGYYADGIQTLAMQSDGKIVAVGTGQQDNLHRPRVILVRYAPNAKVGVENVMLAGGHLVVFPNPARDLITIQIPEAYKKASVTITDMDGRLVRAIPLEHSGAVSVSGLTPGTYVLRLTGGNGQAALYARLTVLP